MLFELNYGGISELKNPFKPVEEEVVSSTDESKTTSRTPS